MSGPEIFANVTTNVSSACDAWITAPLTTSCGVGVCSNATGVPTCVCSPGWSGVGDFDFRHLPLQDADCDKYPGFFRVLYCIGAAASFINFFCAVYMWWDARNKKGRKKTTALMIIIVSVVGFIMWTFRGIDPGRSIGVDPALTIMFSVYLFLCYFGFSYVLGTSTFICLFRRNRCTAERGGRRGGVEYSGVHAVLDGAWWWRAMGDSNRAVAM